MFARFYVIQPYLSDCFPNENVGKILALAPSTLDGHIAVPKTVESSEVGE